MASVGKVLRCIRRHGEKFDTVHTSATLPKSPIIFRNKSFLFGNLSLQCRNRSMPPPSRNLKNKENKYLLVSRLTNDVSFMYLHTCVELQVR